MKTAWMVLALALGTMTATAAPSVALFVQNRAGAQLDGQLDAFQDLIGTRLSDAGFEVIRYQDVLDRFVESRGAEAGQELRQAVEALQTAKAEGTVDGPSREASALRTAQLMGADFLVMASLVSLGENQKNVLAYGTQQEIAETTLRMGLRVLEGAQGRQIYGDILAVNEKVQQNQNIQMTPGDLIPTLLDRGAVALVEHVRESAAAMAAATPEPTLASVTFTSQVAGAAVKCGQGTDAPICITAEGSTYYKLKGMQREVERFLAEWLLGERGIYTRTIQVDDAVVKGAAIAGLLAARRA
ncbi:MAG TPA: hypothetical protein PKX16_05435 [Kiritimatiellia bacterium]|nr:hypothetical protein [Kiritimatiellia bacterium]